MLAGIGMLVSLLLQLGEVNGISGECCTAMRAPVASDEPGARDAARPGLPAMLPVSLEFAGGQEVPEKPQRNYSHRMLEEFLEHEAQGVDADDNAAAGADAPQAF